MGFDIFQTQMIRWSWELDSTCVLYLKIDEGVDLKYPPSCLGGLLAAAARRIGIDKSLAGP